MKKLTLFLTMFFCIYANAQSDLKKIKQEYIDCNEYGVILENVSIEITYADTFSFTTPFAVFVKEIGFSRRYKILIAPNIESKKEAVYESLNAIIEYEVKL